LEDVQQGKLMVPLVGNVPSKLRKWGGRFAGKWEEVQQGKLRLGGEIAEKVEDVQRVKLMVPVVCNEPSKLR